VNLTFAAKADKGYQKLPSNIQKKADKQFLHLLKDYRHPSLQTKKMKRRCHIFYRRKDNHHSLNRYA
jgi:mRNA-degrading endonuclease RelE of RelBE toxin-antitoxin system